MLTKAFNQLCMAFLDDFARAFPDEMPIKNAGEMVRSMVRCNESSALPLMAFTNGETQELARLDRTIFEIPGMRMQQLASQMTTANRAALEAHLGKLEELALKLGSQMGDLNKKLSEARQSDAYTTIENMINDPKQLLTAASNPEQLAAFGEVLQQNDALKNLASNLKATFDESPEAQDIVNQAQSTVQTLLGGQDLQSLVARTVAGGGGGASIEDLQRGVQNLLLGAGAEAAEEDASSSSSNKRKRRPKKLRVRATPPPQ